MKNSVKSNMYAYTLRSVEECFAPHIKGNALAPICVISFSRLSERSSAALMNSGERLGFGRDSCVFVTICAEEAKLDEKDVFYVVEGIDPFCLIIADEQSIAACAQAYRQIIEPLKRGRLLGREVRAFLDFDSMLDNAQEKQRAWALLKSLPRLS